ncbi:Sec-independent protein translocase TatC [Myceligenerans xiligouense]|uniref:Sec-independent protein translocase protein TatC n=2 Tax=Myceligenerans xiligouense TaxID=253184 RepID=A0A3N4YKB4_9MICO|nr:twin-arginine translocase subunit TatC [Myceligenerans xiligouense]RPF21549.1 Sec-independent protein translocase TatC [Myceligenerans xiligouense]
MPLIDHLKELRKRIVLVALGLVVGAIAGWLLYDPLLQALQRPLDVAEELTGNQMTLNFAGPMAALDLKIKSALFLAVFLTCPWWLYQLWAFITPGLTKKEKRYAYVFVGAAVPLFLGGALMAWFVFPHAIQILSGFLPEEATGFTDAQGYLSLMMRLLIAFGLSFLSPVVLTVLNFTGVLPAAAMAKGWRWAVLVAFTFAAVMTPTPDPWTMILVALPICLLYFVALGIAWLHDRRQEKKLAEL